MEQTMSDFAAKLPPTEVGGLALADTSTEIVTNVSTNPAKESTDLRSMSPTEVGCFNQDRLENELDPYLEVTVNLNFLLGMKVCHTQLGEGEIVSVNEDSGLCCVNYYLHDRQIEFHIDTAIINHEL